MRINAFLARAGLGSRRSVEELVRSGCVSVNGKIVTDLSTRIDSSRDVVLCNRKRIEPEALHYVVLNKPRGYACTREDPHAPKTIYDLMPSEFRSLAYAGRLDIDSEGMVLLSNDGTWLQKLMHPRHEVLKFYRVEVEGSPTPETLETAQRGIKSRGENLKVDKVHIIKVGKNFSLLHVELRQGRNREIRRIFGSLKHEVIRLQRIGVGSLRLENLKPGRWRELDRKEVQKLGTEKD